MIRRSFEQESGTPSLEPPPRTEEIVAEGRPSPALLSTTANAPGASASRQRRRLGVAALLAAALGATVLGWFQASTRSSLSARQSELLAQLSDAQPSGVEQPQLAGLGQINEELRTTGQNLGGGLALILLLAAFGLYWFGRSGGSLRDRRLSQCFVVSALLSLAVALGLAGHGTAGVALDAVKAIAIGLVLWLLLREIGKGEFAPDSAMTPPWAAAGASGPLPTTLSGRGDGPVSRRPRDSGRREMILDEVDPSRGAASPRGAPIPVEGEDAAFHNLLFGSVPLPPSAEDVLLPPRMENSVTDETNPSCEPLAPPLGAPRFDNVPDMETYRELYAESVTDPEEFWSAQARRLKWEQPWTRTLEWDFHTAEVKWFQGGKLNVSTNCVDRHVEAGHGNQVAIVWEGDDPGESRKYTYRELQREVCRFANVLKSKGVSKGDRVCIYLPMIPELAFAMLACARIGAVHSVVFAGFSAHSLRDRILDSECKVLITADEGLRGGKTIPLKKIADEALKDCACIESMLLVRRTGRWQPCQDGREVWIEDLLSSGSISDECPAEPMDAEDPLFILYTSGSTGKPKGVLHTTGGYLTYAAFTHQTIFDHQPGEVYWCTADIGWITGHSYIVYGPLANRATTLMFEGVPSYPDHGRFWDVVDKHQVAVFYTAPTAIRAVAQHGDAPVKARKRSSLRLLGTVGEPINPEIWKWYHQVVGDGRCPIVDTWWQTETGGILISPLPRATPLKPGSATLPFFGVRPVLVDEEGTMLEGNEVSGNLCIAFPWPGMMRTVYGDHERFVETYFSRFPGRYFTGDGCRRDADGYYWITGRVDDVLNVSGHRMGTAEVESALVAHPAVAEAAVVGYPHEIKGTGIYAYCILNDGHEASEALHAQLIAHVRQEIGPIAAPDKLHFTPGLPKTRSGKIMRRILRKVAEGQTEDFGDTSTLADPSVVDRIVEGAR